MFTGRGAVGHDHGEPFTELIAVRERGLYTPPHHPGVLDVGNMIDVVLPAL